jgi:hypothetical protein
METVPMSHQAVNKQVPVEGRLDSYPGSLLPAGVEGGQHDLQVVVEPPVGDQLALLVEYRQVAALLRNALLHGCVELTLDDHGRDARVTAMDPVARGIGEALEEIGYVLRTHHGHGGSVRFETRATPFVRVTKGTPPCRCHG